VIAALEKLLEVRELHIEDVEFLLGLPDYIDAGSMTYIQKRMGCRMSVLIMMVDGDSISGVTMCIITDVSDMGGPLKENEGGRMLGAALKNKLYESEQSKTNQMTDVKQERVKSSE
jgi:hypothetical protein